MQVHGDGPPRTQHGEIKWVSAERGYGFVTLESGKDIFVHRTEVLVEELGSLRPGDPVRFDVEQRSKGPTAVRLTRDDTPSAPSPASAFSLGRSTEAEEVVFLLDEEGGFRYLPCTRGPMGNVVVESGDLASVLTAADLPSVPLGAGRLWRICSQFEQLINDQGADESAIQEFFEEYPGFLLADRYEALYPQVVLPMGSSGSTLRPDFILRPFAGMTHEPEIVELKLPRQRIVKLKRNHVGLFSPILDAVDQLRSYARVFADESSREAIAEKLGFAAHRPSLALVVGRAADIPSRRLGALATEGIEPIQLHTYDDLLLRFRRRAGLD